MDSKRCIKCGKDKDVDCFHKATAKKDGLAVYCKECMRLYREENKERITISRRKWYKDNKERASANHKQWYKDNKERASATNKRWRNNNKEYISAKKKQYNEENKERIADTQRKYYEDNKERFMENNKLYRANNKEKLVIHSKQYYEENKERILSSTKKYREDHPELMKQRRDDNREVRRIKRNSPSKSKILFDQIPISDEPKYDSEGYITVLCKMDGKRFRPTESSISSRIVCTKGVQSGECNFYCQDSCRDACPLFGFDPFNSIDPRSDLYISKSEQEEARKCQTDHLKILQMDEFGYNFCEKCGSEVDIVELHHTLPVASFGLEAINSAGHLLVCNDCHKEFTKDCKI